MNIYHEKIENNITIKRLEAQKSNRSAAARNSWHKNIEICKFVSGEFDVIINNQKRCASAGDIIVINSGEIHRFEPKSEKCAVDICTFNPLILYNLSTDFSNIKNHIKSEEVMSSGIEKEISECFDNLMSEKSKDDSAVKIIMQAILLKIYGLLVRHFKKEGNPKTGLSKLNAFHKIIEYISDNYSEEISLSILAEKFNYSPVYISSAFAACTGVNFKYYLDNVRVSKSIEMLTETTASISEIATSCGFDNIRTFNNVFKKIVGDTPKSIRKS